MAIYKENVNHEADTLIIENTNTEKTLVKFEDYSILLREGLPYFTLKINNNTSIRAIL
jgi:hypothetical protein